MAREDPRVLDVPVDYYSKNVHENTYVANREEAQAAKVPDHGASLFFFKLNVIISGNRRKLACVDSVWPPNTGSHNVLLIVVGFLSNMLEKNMQSSQNRLTTPLKQYAGKEVRSHTTPLAVVET